MPIYYCVVSRGMTVLARCADPSCTGNFQEVTAQVLSQIPNKDSKLTYTNDSYLFHYVSEQGLIYMCITDDEFERGRAFLFLHEVKKRFETMYGSRSQTAIAYAMNSEFGPVLRGQISQFGEGKNVDNIASVHGQLDELKDIMVKNISNAAMRGEKLELLIDKADNLSSTSTSFRQSSRVLQRNLFWNDVKYYVAAGFAVLLIVYLIISMFCGGLAWSTCVG